jgi:tetratricopeptide (TPR) repeat protein
MPDWRSYVTGRRRLILRSAGVAALVASATVGVRAAGTGARWQSVRERLHRLEVRYHVHLGHQSFGKGRYLAAVREYQTAMVLDPALPAPGLYLAEAHLRLADSAGRRGPSRREHLRRAALWLRREAENGRAPEPALRRLLRVYGPERLDSPAGMEWALRRILERGAARPDDSLALARLYEARGRNGDAEAALLAARRDHPDTGAVHRRLATFYRRREERRASIAVLESWLARDPGDREAALALVMGLWDAAARNHEQPPERRNRQVGRALEVLDRLLAEGRPEPAVLLYKSVFLRLLAAGAEPGERRDALLSEADALRARARPPNPPARDRPADGAS